MTIPPSRNVGDGNHVSDHNDIAGELTSLTSELSGKSDTGHSHAGTDIASGTVPAARLGSGTSITTKYLRGDGTWQTITTADIPHEHDASDITSGTLDIDLIGTGTQDGAHYLRDDGVWSIPSSTGNPGAPTILVAASNSPASIRARADYVCDGASDEVEINAALTAAANRVGGTGTRQSSVTLADGDYSLLSSVLIPNRGLTLSGSSFLTRLYRQGSGFTNTGSGTSKALIKMAATEEARSASLVTIKNMTLDGTSTSSGVSGIIWDTASGSIDYSTSTYGQPGTDPDSYCKFADLYIANVDNGILIKGSSSVPRNNYIENVTVREFADTGIGGNSSSDNVINRCFVQSGRANNCVGIETPGGSTIITNCKVAYTSINPTTGGVGYVLSSSRGFISGCESQDNPYGINITGSQSVVTGLKVDTQVTNSGVGVRAVYIGANNVKFDGQIQTRDSGTWDRALEFSSGSHDHMVNCFIVSDGITKYVNIGNGSEITSTGSLPDGSYQIRVTGVRTLLV